MSADERKIHVLHLIGSTGLYGAERWILALMRAMDKDRIRSTLINLVDVAGDRSAVVAASHQRGLDAFDFVTGGRFNMAAAFRLAQWAKDNGVTIIHGHGFKSDLVGLLAARIAGCRMMTTPHGWSLEDDWKLGFYEQLDRFSFRFMDMICPLSPDLADGLRDLIPPHRLKLIYNGVDIDEILETAPALRAFPEYFLIGYIGQLIERKDLSTLLKAIETLSVDKRRLRVMIVGDGPKRGELKEEADRLGLREIVQFAGYRSDAASLLKTFDLFALPSRLEGIPRCIMEALAGAVPVAISDIPGNRNLVSDMETGLLFPVGDSSILAGKIAWVMEHPAEAAAMAERGRQKVEQEYSNRKMAREYATVYAELSDTAP